MNYNQSQLIFMPDDCRLRVRYFLEVRVDDVENMEMVMKPIGVVRSPFKTLPQTPRWGTMTEEIGEIEVFPQYEAGLEGIERYSRIELLFYFHQSRRDVLKVIPPHDPKERGVFASRAPVRPNPIGLTILNLLERKGRFLKVKHLDMLDGTPVLDIKPHKE